MTLRSQHIVSVMFRALINLTALLLLSPLDTESGPGQMSAPCCSAAVLQVTACAGPINAAPGADGECLLRIRCRPSLL